AGGTRGHRELCSFPTRRSSDLSAEQREAKAAEGLEPARHGLDPEDEGGLPRMRERVEPLARAGAARTAEEHAMPAPRVERLDHRSEEHTSELQSRENLVCRPLL